ncbi:hypothetical protein [Salinibacter ruber]|uniref:Lipoprotein n=1 Tax=Salinibacter ruber TaxID=146919 RepID=A0A9X2UNB5_9BACT|nr:hypothetical protein [Salinibacter ruber]MCS4038026.1 hypothetical protein [Salinibacter ruber]
MEIIRKNEILTTAIILAFIITSCGDENTSIQQNLGKMVEEIKNMGDQSEIRVVDLKKFKNKNKLKITQEFGTSITMKKEGEYGEIYMSYEIGRRNKGALEYISFFFKKGATEEELDRMSKNLSKLFEEKPRTTYEKPISKKNEKKRYLRHARNIDRTTYLSYELSSEGGPMMRIGVSRGIEDIGRSYYLTKIYNYEPNRQSK